MTKRQTRATYSDRAEARRKELGISIREVARQVANNKAAKGERGASYSGIRKYLSGRRAAPRNPRPAIIRALAEVLGVSVAYLVGETDVPGAEGEADVRRQVWASLERAKERERDAIEQAFPDLRSLSPTARAAIQDLVVAIRTDATRRQQGRPPDTEVATRIGKALTNALRATGLGAPDEIRSVSDDTPAELRTPFLHLTRTALSDFVVLTCQGLKGLYR